MVAHADPMLYRAVLREIRGSILARLQARHESYAESSAGRHRRGGTARLIRKAERLTA